MTTSAQTRARSASSLDAPARRERARAILRAKRSGRTWREISERFGLSERQCRRAARSAEIISAEESLAGLTPDSIHGRTLAVQSRALDVLEAEMERGDNSSARVGAARAASVVAGDLRASAAWAGLLPPPKRARDEREWREIVNALLDSVEELGGDHAAIKAVLERETEMFSGAVMNGAGAGP